MPRAFRLSAVLVALLAVQALPARAQLEGKPFEQGLRAPDSLLDGSAHDRHTQISAYGNYSPWGLGLGAGVRYSLPIFKDGFIPELNDSVEVEAGGNFLFGIAGTPSVVIGALEPKWTVHFTPQLEGYVKLGIGLFLWLGPTNLSPVNPLFAGGVAYKFLPNFWIKLEGGILGGALGVGLDF